jgi:hypothetical protein
MYCQYNSSVSNLLRWNMLVTNNYSREHTIHCQFYSIFPYDMCMLHASKIESNHMFIMIRKLIMDFQPHMSWSLCVEWFQERGCYSFCCLVCFIRISYLFSNGSSSVLYLYYNVKTQKGLPSFTVIAEHSVVLKF